MELNTYKKKDGSDVHFYKVQGILMKPDEVVLVRIISDIYSNENVWKDPETKTDKIIKSAALYGCIIEEDGTQQDSIQFKFNGQSRRALMSINPIKGDFIIFKRLDWVDKKAACTRPIVDIIKANSDGTEQSEPSKGDSDDRNNDLSNKPVSTGILVPEIKKPLKIPPVSVSEPIPNAIEQKVFNDLNNGDKESQNYLNICKSVEGAVYVTELLKSNIKDYDVSRTDKIWEWLQSNV